MPPFFQRRRRKRNDFLTNPSKMSAKVVDSRTRRWMKKTTIREERNILEVNTTTKMTTTATRIVLNGKTSWRLFSRRKVVAKISRLTSRKNVKRLNVRRRRSMMNHRQRVKEVGRTTRIFRSAGIFLTLEQVSTITNTFIWPWKARPFYKYDKQIYS